MKSRPVDVGNTCRRDIRRDVTQGTVEGSFYEGAAGNGAAIRGASGGFWRKTAIHRKI
jgi:ADP-ribosyl-[dinitrogen reductase] hydrolase